MAGNQIYNNDLTLVSFGSAILFYSSWCQKWWRSHKFTFFFPSIPIFEVFFSGGVSYQNVHLYILSFVKTWTLNRVKAWGVGNWGATEHHKKSKISSKSYVFVFIFPKILFKMILHWKDFKILYLALEKIISWQFNGISKYFLCDWLAQASLLS